MRREDYPITWEEPGEPTLVWQGLHTQETDFGDGSFGWKEIDCEICEKEEKHLLRFHPCEDFSAYCVRCGKDNLNMRGEELIYLDEEDDDIEEPVKDLSELEISERWISERIVEMIARQEDPELTPWAGIGMPLHLARWVKPDIPKEEYGEYGIVWPIAFENTGEGATAPWVAYAEESQMQSRIVACCNAAPHLARLVIQLRDKLADGATRTN